jgi:ATP-dependent 26S proteasome regulatory subunit
VGSVVDLARALVAREIRVRSKILTELLEAHLDRDEERFRKLALQLAAVESKAGHTRIADEIRAILSKVPETRAMPSPVVDLAQPRGEMADVLDGGYSHARLGDIVLSSETRERLERVLLENRSRAKLESFNVAPKRRLLFYGPPGCGKTFAASVIAGELGLPLMTVRVDGLFSRFLGATANHLRAIFAEMPRRPGVYLFDEFDALAKARNDGQDVGEARRILTAFLQLIDADKSHSLVIAATNHVESLDKAVFRRFDLRLSFELPTSEEVAELIKLRLAAMDLDTPTVERVATASVGLSFADVAAGCDEAIRTMVLDGRRRFADRDLVEGFARTTASGSGYSG